MKLKGKDDNSMKIFSISAVKVNRIVKRLITRKKHAKKKQLKTTQWLQWSQTLNW